MKKINENEGKVWDRASATWIPAPLADAIPVLVTTSEPVLAIPTPILEVPVSVPPVQVNPDTVSVPKSVLDQMVADMAKLKQDNTMFKEIASKERLDWYQSKNPVQKIKNVKLTKCNGKLVMAWRTLKNVVQQDSKTGIWSEDQQYELILEDNSKVEINGYRAFATALSADNKIDAQVVDEIKSNGGVSFKVKVEDREIIISSAFVN